MLRELWFATILSCVVAGNPLAAQVTPATILEIDVHNIVGYSADVFDPSKFASDPNRTTPGAVRNFGFLVAVGDIVLVNGRPAKGTVVIQSRLLSLSPTPNPGQAIADIVRGQIAEILFEIQQVDGTPVGSIHSLGLAGGGGLVGAPAGIGNFTIAGGTAAFLGARGQIVGRAFPGVMPARNASVTEDPERRRNLAAGERAQYAVQLIPMTRPEILVTPTGPAVTHSSDFSLVTASKPARPGEILSLFATGLGPARAVDPSKPFPADPLAVVNSPVEVMVDGRPAELLAAVGYPGTLDRYQVNFRIPAETASGSAAIQLSAAWITGPEVRIPVSR